MDSNAQESQDLFFDALVRGYVENNPRFLRREWLAKALDEKLRETGRRFVLLTAEPGAGKSAFVAQLAHDHPEWLRYFIRRDQRYVLADVSDKSLLLRIGYQLAALRPELFSQEQLRLSVVQRIGQVAEQAEAVGVEVKRLIDSPFQDKLVTVVQHVQANHGKVVGLRVEELVVEARLLPSEDLLYLALIHPARALQRIDPKRLIVILIDALDEIRYHPTTENILTWLTNCPELPENIRFVLTSRPPDEALKLFCTKQAAYLGELAIAEEDTHVKQDIERFVTKLVGEPQVAKALEAAGGGAEAFAKKATDKAHGNLGYLDALARGIDQAVRNDDEAGLQALLSLKELPGDLGELYAFFLHQIKAGVARERLELKDPESGESYDKPVWPAVYDRILGVLAVAMEPLELDLIEQLGGIRAGRSWVIQALERLMQFLDVVNDRYHLYHATVPEFLTAEKTRANRATLDLYQDANQRHLQIADHYWANRGDWSHCDDYGLRNLAAHLYHGQQNEKLVRLITTSPHWMEAKFDAFSSDESFIADIDIAISNTSDVLDLVRLYVALQVVRLKAVNYDDEDLRTLALLDRFEEARSYARLRPEPRKKVSAFLSILAAVKERAEIRSALLDEALTAADAIEHDFDRKSFLGDLGIAFLQAGRLDQAKKVGGAWPPFQESLVQALVAKTQFDEALSIARSITDPRESEARARFLGLIGSGLARAGDDRAGCIFQEALTVAREGKPEERQAVALGYVAAALESASDSRATPVFNEAVEFAYAIPSDKKSFMSRWLPGHGQSLQGETLHKLAVIMASIGLTTKALEVAQAISGPNDALERFKALCDVAVELACIGDGKASAMFSNLRELAIKHAHETRSNWRESATRSRSEDDPLKPLVAESADEPMLMLAKGLARAGRLAETEAIARYLASPRQRLDALRSLAVRLAETRDRRAPEIFREVNKLTHSVGDNSAVTSLVPDLASGLAKARYFAEAKRAAGLIEKGWTRWNAMRNIGCAMAEAGLLTEARELADSIDAPEKIPQQLIMYHVAKRLAQIRRFDEAASATLETGMFASLAVADQSVEMAKAGHPDLAFAAVTGFIERLSDASSSAMILRRLATALAHSQNATSRAVLEAVMEKLRQCVRSVSQDQAVERIRASGELAVALAELGDPDAEKFFAETINSIVLVTETIGVERENVQSWLVSTWAEAGYFHQARQLALSMENRLKRDDVLRDVSEVLADKGYFNDAIELVGAIQDKDKHLLALADTLARSGRLSEAFEVLGGCGPYVFPKTLASWAPFLEKFGEHPATTILREILGILAWANNAYSNVVEAVLPSTHK